MALLMVMTVCLLLYAALEYRILQALHAHAAIFPEDLLRLLGQPYMALYDVQYSSQ
jgi:hypothetical protein